MVGGHVGSDMFPYQSEEWDAVLEVFTPEAELVWAAFPVHPLSEEDPLWEESAASVNRVGADPGGVVYVHTRGHPAIDHEGYHLEAYADGNLLWRASSGSAGLGGDFRPWALALDGEGGVLDLGPSYAPCQAEEVAEEVDCVRMFRFDASGDILWLSTVPLLEEVRNGYAAAASRVGEGIVSALWAATTSIDMPVEKTVLLLHDMSGELRCTDVIDGESVDHIAVVAEDRIAVTGSVRDDHGQWHPRLTLLSIDPDGR